MSNEQLVRSAHIYALVVFVFLFGVVVFASGAAYSPADLAQQNSNSNANSNSNTSQNQNTNANTKTRNANNANETAEQTGTPGKSSKDQKFLMDAAMGGLMEVELGRWASQKGTSAEVKQFGQRMVADHSKANTELTQLAASKGITLPTQLDEKHQSSVSKITRLNGAEFDRAYSKMMLKDHEHDVSDFEKQSTKGEDAEIKAFAAKTLPTLQEHLQMARALPGNAGKVNSNSSGNSNSNGNSNRP